MGTRIRGKLETETDVDVYAFDATSGKTYHLSIEDDFHTNVSASASDEVGKTVATRHNWWQMDRGHDCFDDFPFLDQMRWHAKSHGIHYLRIAPNPYGEPTFGKYSFKIDEYESADDHPNFASDATRIKIGQPVEGIIEWGRDSDQFRFIAEPDQTYTITTQTDARQGLSFDVVDADDQLLPLAPTRSLFEVTDVPQYGGMFVPETMLEPDCTEVAALRGE